MAAILNIPDKWGLTKAQQMISLGMDVESKFFNYSREPMAAEVNKDMLKRLSYVLGIFKDLQIFLSDESSANSSIKKQNRASPFCGKSAVEYLTESGSIVDLHRVRRYLAER